jgi:ElaB/YqjD/DUF883 family membrane-anchored ribosome-binding protein
MKASELKKEAQKSLRDLRNSAKKNYSSTLNEAVESGREALDYVKANPVKAVLYGLLGYFAVKTVIDKL